MYSILKNCIDELFEKGYVHNIAIRYGSPDDYHDFFRGTENELTENTNFDMASVTKVICTGTLSLMALDEGKLRLEDRVADYFPCSDEKKGLTIRHLLLHEIGFGYKPLFSMAEHPEDIVETILHIPCEFPVGTEVEYSCPGYILLGKILEKIYKKQLNVLFDEKIAAPLGFRDTGFGKRKGAVINANETEELRGIVNDRNCRFLNGVAGNAGIFSNLRDLTVFSRMCLQYGSPLIKSETFHAAVRNHTPAFALSRCLGFQYVDAGYRQTGNLFPTGSFGHCGHTGQSVFFHPEKNFFAIILSDMTLSVSEEYDIVMNSREKIHNAILADMRAEYREGV